MSKVKSPQQAMLLVALCTFAGVAHAKRVAPIESPIKQIKQAVQFELKDPVTGDVLRNTPYVLITPETARNAAIRPAVTDAQGKTKAIKSLKTDLSDPTAPVILVQAEGTAGEVLLYNLNDVIEKPEPALDETGAAVVGEAVKPIANATPYVIWNKINNIALCGYGNAQGYTRAYFVENKKIWDGNTWVVPLKQNPVCSDARSALSELVNKDDSQGFENGFAYAKANFAVSEHQLNDYAYQHAISIIANKQADIQNSANKKAIQMAVDLAKANKDSSTLNSIGYDLSFSRGAYKQALPLLSEALNIKPNDCYYLNSKGYVLMRLGKLKESRDLLQASDVACNAVNDNGGAREGEDMDYPIAVNLAHLAENYALSGDAYIANQMLSRALALSPKAAIEEITEVVKSLTEKQIISKENLQAFIEYLNQSEAPPAAAQAGAATVDAAKSAAKAAVDAAKAAAAAVRDEVKKPKSSTKKVQIRHK